MQRLSPQEAEVRLSNDEIAAVLERLRERAPEPEFDPQADLRPRAEDLAEVAGVSPEEVVEALAEVREERSRVRARAEASAAQTRRRRRGLRSGAALLIFAIAVLNLHVGSDMPYAVAKIGWNASPASGMRGKRFDVEIDYRPSTLWRRIVRPHPDLHLGSATLTLGGKPVELVDGEGNKVDALQGPELVVVGSQIHLGYDSPWVRRTSERCEIVQRLTVDGENFDLHIPIP